MREIKYQPASYSARPEPGEPFESRAQVMAIAAGVISQADASHPADSVLRHDLTNRRRVSPEFRTEVTGVVFAFYRWFGWLNPQQSIVARLEHAQQLQERFFRQTIRFQR